MKSRAFPVFHPNACAAALLVIMSSASSHAKLALNVLMPYILAKSKTSWELSVPVPHGKSLSTLSPDRGVSFQ